jgi:uncharacterized integral membrane protein
MKRITLILALILVGALALFGAQNTETMTLHFLWFTTRSVPLPLAMLGGAVVGALLSFLVALPDRARRTIARGGLTRRRARREACPQTASASAERVTRVAP